MGKKLYSMWEVISVSFISGILILSVGGKV